MSVQGKKILVGISGSIAAYKSAFLVRLLIKRGAEVKVLMTPSSKDFISPLTLSTLSKNPVYSDVSSEEGWNNHVDLGLWADAFVIAPATANTLAKMANGICDNILLAVYLSARCPVFVAPAMDLDMWKHPATRKNVAQLEEYGLNQIPVEHGDLASGLVGEGRMAEPQQIIKILDQFFDPKPQDLVGKKVLITSGPTFEIIDPVRFIGNRSSGKMGAAIAEELSARGAKVVVVSGPARILPQSESIILVSVESAQEMYEACLKEHGDSDITILAAAVADYTPEFPSGKKIKKSGADLNIRLKKTNDIALELGRLKNDHQIHVGFALETDDEIRNAKQKLEKKNLDFIVLNSLNDKGAGFGHETNKVTFLGRDGDIREFNLKSKQQVAVDIVNKIVDLIHADRAADL